MPSTPAQFQYQPLGLERFAQPMAMKQQKLDLTTEAIEQSDFGVDSLSVDSERASAMSERLMQDRETLIEELQRTKNYKQAAKKIKELNKIYHSDPEISGIRQQKQAFQEWDKAARKKVDEGDMTLEDYNRRKFYRMKTYEEKGGFGYDRESGASNVMDTSPIEENLEPEIQKLSMELANATPLQIKQVLGEWGVDGNIDGLISQFSTKIEERDFENVKREISQFLRQSQRYKDNIKSKAKIDYFWESRHNPNFGTQVIEHEHNKINAKKQQILEGIQSGQLKGEDAQRAQEALKRLEQDNAHLNDMYSQSVNEGRVDDLAEKLFSQNKYDETIEGWAEGASDMIDVFNVIENNAVRNLPEGKSGGRGKVQSAEEFKTTTRTLNMTSTTGDYEGLKPSDIQAGTSTHLEKIRTLLFEDSEEMADHIKNIESNAEPLPEDSSDEERKEFEIRNTINTVIDRSNKYKEKKEELQGEKDILKEKLENSEGKEQQEYRVKLRNLNEELKLVEESELVDFRPLENIIEEVMGTMSAVPEGPAELELLEEVRRIYNEEGASGIAKAMLAERLHDSDYPISPTMEVLGWEEKNPLLKNPRMRSIFKEYRNNIVSGSAKYPPQEFILDDPANAFTDGKIAKVRDNTIGVEGRAGEGKIEAVTYDSSTGKTKVEKDINYSKDAYDWKNASFIAITEKETGNKNFVFRAIRKELDENEQIKLGREKAKVLDPSLNDEDISLEVAAQFYNNWAKNNPQDLYVEVSGYDESVTEVKESIDDKMLANLHEFERQAVEGRTPEERHFATKNARDLRNTHAKWLYNINPTVKESYNEMATGIQKMMSNKNKDQRIPERSPEFIPTGNPASPYKKNEIIYRLDQDDMLVMEKREIYYDEDFNQKGVSESSFSPISTINPIDLISIGTYYGVGIEDVLIRHSQGTGTYIPSEVAID